MADEPKIAEVGAVDTPEHTLSAEQRSQQEILAELSDGKIEIIVDEETVETAIQQCLREFENNLRYEIETNGGVNVIIPFEGSLAVMMDWFHRSNLGEEFFQKTNFMVATKNPSGEYVLSDKVQPEFNIRILDEIADSMHAGIQIMQAVRAQLDPDNQQGQISRADLDAMEDEERRKLLDDVFGDSAELWAIFTKVDSAKFITGKVKVFLEIPNRWANDIFMNHGGFMGIIDVLQRLYKGPMTASDLDLDTKEVDNRVLLNYYIDHFRFANDGILFSVHPSFVLLFSAFNPEGDRIQNFLEGLYHFDTHEYPPQLVQMIEQLRLAFPYPES